MDMDMGARSWMDMQLGEARVVYGSRKRQRGEIGQRCSWLYGKSYLSIKVCS
jgi:hypothetical protein